MKTEGGGGMRMGKGLLLVVLVVVLAEVCVIAEWPGAGVGILGLMLAGIMYGVRRRKPWGAGEWIALGLLMVAMVQAVRWTSLSNVLVILVGLTWLNGMVVHGGRLAGWRQWLEGCLVFVRPLGVWESCSEAMGEDGSAGGIKGKRILVVLRVLFPAILLLGIFGWLLVAGNAVLENCLQMMVNWLERIFGIIDFPEPGRVFLWGVFFWIGLVLVYAAKPAKISGILTGSWRELGKGKVLIRGYQWLAVLVAMNLLFLFSTVTDVVYLWMSRELPDGITHSRYLHQGVGVLILTTLLSAFILGTLTQHDREIRRSRVLRSLAHAWIGQNLLLISGVFLRLHIYVDAYGYTPRRVYVMLFLLLVVGGFLLLIWALARLKTMRWLVGANLLLLFGHFSILQLVDVPGIVARLNMDLYQEGTIGYPEEQFLHQIWTHSVPYLIEIRTHPQQPEHAEMAMVDLKKREKALRNVENRPWQSFQYRDYRNLKAWEEFKDKHGPVSDQTSRHGGEEPAKEHP